MRNLNKKVNLFDEVKKKNEELEGKIKRTKEENTSQLKEMTRLKEENAQLRACNECQKSKPFVSDVSCGTEDVSFSFDKCEFAEDICAKKCSIEHVKEFANLSSCDNMTNSDKGTSCSKNNVGLKIMKMRGYTGQGFGKHEQGMRNPIEPTMRPKNEGL